jgi:hypothetical protein
MSIVALEGLARGVQHALRAVSVCQASRMGTGASVSCCAPWHSPVPGMVLHASLVAAAAVDRVTGNATAVPQISRTRRTGGTRRASHGVRGVFSRGPCAKGWRAIGRKLSAHRPGIDSHEHRARGPCAAPGGPSRHTVCPDAPGVRLRGTSLVVASVRVMVVRAELDHQALEAMATVAA